jgi:hypothetical protein
MNERVTKNKASATPPVATQACSPLLHQRSLTSELSESVGSNSEISKELGGIQPKTIRRSLNWHAYQSLGVLGGLYQMGFNVNKKNQGQ